MAGSRSYGNYSYGHGYTNYNSTATPYSFIGSSNYISGPSYQYHHVKSPVSSRAVSVGAIGSSSSSYLSRPSPSSSSYALKSYVKATPTRIIKPSMPSISETHVFSSRPTPPPPSIPLTIYRPLAALAAVQEAKAKRNSGRWNVRNTANIDVVTRPRSRMEHDNCKQDSAAESPSTTATVESSSSSLAIPQHRQATAERGRIQRDFTVGTLKRGRKVIRLETNRLPSLEQQQENQPQPSREGEGAPSPPQQPRAIRAYGAERLEPAAIPGRVKKTPGERMKEKFLIPSRKGAGGGGGGQAKRAFAGGVNQLSSDYAPPRTVVPQLVISNDSGLGSSPIVSLRDPKTPVDDQSKKNLTFFLS